MPRETRPRPTRKEKLHVKPSTVIILVLLAALALGGCAKQQESASTPSTGESAPSGAAGTAPDAAGGAGQTPAAGTPMGTPMASADPHSMPPPSGMEVTPPSKEGMTSNSAAGVRWNLPAGWEVGAERPRRVATYTVPPAGGDTEGGECAVFYFGPGQGGNADANIERWIGQFESGARSKRSNGTVGGMALQNVEVEGTYLAPSGPMMQSSGSRPGYRLLGAIVEAPEGLVFFKFTGPEKTVQGARGAFDGMVRSIKKG
jgi:hypothetical protein